MKVWAGLYAMVWLAFLELLVAIDPKPPSWSIYVHAVLGALLLLLAAFNFVQVRATPAPGRTKRTVRATLGFSILMVFLGALLWAGTGSSGSVVRGYSVWDLIHVLHVVSALAIFAQAASAATAFDMWEEREFQRGSTPGEVPPAPTSTG